MIKSEVLQEIETLFGESVEDKIELKAFLVVLHALDKELADRYEIVGKLGRGGTAIVLKVMDKKMEVPRALKCARPIPGREPVLSRIVGSEINKLRGVSHPNIVTIFYFGEVEAEHKICPYYVMEFVENGIDLEEYLVRHRNSITEIRVISLIRQLIEGCLHLHEHGMVHGDMKLENALVSPSGVLKISDLGSARYLSTTDHAMTDYIGTYAYFHPRYLAAAQVHRSDDKRAAFKIKRMEVKPDLDIYAIGKNIIRVLAIIDPNNEASLSRYARSYVNLLAARMLDGESDSRLALEVPLKLPRSALAELRYRGLREVIEDIRKLSGEYSLHANIPELDVRHPNKIQCSFFRGCAFTQRLERLLSVGVLRRLGEVSQLGVVVFIYPSASHSRLEHSLGVYAMAVEYCNALWNDPLNPIFRQIVGERWVKTLLCAALCHDIGQYGLAHDFEEAENEIFSHASFTRKVLLGSVSKEIYEPLHKCLNDDWQVDPRDVAKILDADPQNANQEIIPRLLHTVIDGPIDADKADYLLRDSKKLGLPYGEGIDLRRLVDSLSVATKSVGTDADDQRVLITMGVNDKGRIAAESMAFARYALFGSVYWHHTSRALKSMLHRAIWDALDLHRGREGEIGFLSEFESIVLTKVITQRLQLDFDFEHIGTREGPPQSPQLSSGDWQILVWLYGKSSKAGKELINLILNRRVFRRLLVLSYSDNDVDWRYFYDKRMTQLKSFSAFSAFQRSLQSKLIQQITLERLALLKGSAEGLAQASRLGLSEEGIAEIHGRHDAGYVLITVDFPVTRPGSSTELQYISEERVQGKRVLGSSASLKNSMVWRAIHGNFVESIGKARLFAHPDFHGYFEMLITVSDKIQLMKDCT